MVIPLVNSNRYIMERIVDPGIKYFNDEFSASGQLGESVAAFKAARFGKR